MRVCEEEQTLSGWRPPTLEAENDRSGPTINRNASIEEKGLRKLLARDRSKQLSLVGLCSALLVQAALSSTPATDHVSRVASSPCMDVEACRRTRRCSRRLPLGEAAFFFLSLVSLCTWANTSLGPAGLDVSTFALSPPHPRLLLV